MFAKFRNNTNKVSMKELITQLYDVLSGKKKEIEVDCNELLIQALVDVTLEHPEKPEDVQIKVKKKKLYKDVILVSGGQDSTITYNLLLDINLGDSSRFKSIYVDLGQEYVEQEKKALDKLGIKYEVIKYDISKLPKWKHILPARNLILLSIAEQFVDDGGKIHFGVVDGESENDKGDKSELFFKLFEEYIARTKQKYITIETMKGKTKNDWLKEYIDFAKDESILDTITCFAGGEKHCGKCQACVRKWIAMRYCELPTNDMFEINPYEGGKEYIDKYKRVMTLALENKNFTHYSKKRCEQDLKVIQDYETNL